MQLSDNIRINRPPGLLSHRPSLVLASNAFDGLERHPLVNFTRSGPKWYFGSNGLLQEASTNSLPTSYRYDGSNWVRAGWLIEESRTNEILDSRDLTTGNWTNSATVTRDQVGIDGVANTACLLEDTNNSGFEYRVQNVTIPDDNSSWTATVFIEKDSDETRFPALRCYLLNGTTEKQETFFINTKTGDTHETSSDGSFNIEDYGDWWRLSITLTNNSTGNTTFQINLFPAGSDSLTGGFVGSATGSAIVDQVQVENASFPSSPIITSGSAVTRSADVCDITDLGWYNQNEGTFVVEAKTPLLGSGDYDSILQFNDGTNNNRIDIGVLSDRLYLSITDGGIEVYKVYNNDVGYTDDTFFKVAYGLKDGDGVVAFNGSIASEDTSGMTLNFTLTNLLIGSDIATRRFNGCIKSLKYYPKRLSDSQLQSLTS